MTDEERREMEASWDYLFSIPPGEVKHHEWHETALELRVALTEAREEVAALRRTAEARDRALVDIRDTLRTAIEHHHECYGGRSEHFGVTLAYSEILEMHEELAAALAAPDGGK